jgi:uncharacterized repeat protein (TIGR01451 family)
MTKSKSPLIRLLVLFSIVASLALGVEVRSQGAAPFGDLTWISNLFFPDDSIVIQQTEKSSPLGQAPDIDKSLLLDGSGFVEISFPQSLLTSEWTFETWIKPTTTSQRQGIVEFRESDSVELSIVITEDARIVANLAGKSSNLKLSSNGESLKAGEWHHISLTEANGAAELFVDGTLAERGSVDHVNLGSAMLVGGPGEGGGAAHFKGLIDEIRVARFINPARRGVVDKGSVGEALDNGYVGIWRFDSIAESVNKSVPKLHGKIWFSPETADLSNNQSTELVPYCGTTPVYNSVCRRFDEFPSGIIASSIYPDASFTGDPGSGNVFITDNYTDDGGGGSAPNILTGYRLSTGSNNYFAELRVNFASPVDNLSFRVTGLDQANYFYATLSITQQDGTVSHRGLVNHGYAIPVDYYLGLATCDNGPCTNVTSIRISSISDPAGISYDNFSFTPSGQPVPTPTPTGATPTPTPPYTDTPTNFTLVPEVGQVRATWLPGASGADVYEVWRVASGGDQLLATLQAGNLVYVDRDVKIRASRSYYIIARLNGNPSIRTETKFAAPISPCDSAEFDQFPVPDIGLPNATFSGHGWSGEYSKGFGVVSVKLNNRYMGDMYGAYYVKVKTNKMAVPQQIVLVPRESFTPAGNQGFLSKAYGYAILTEASGVTLRTNYCVSSPSGQARWVFMVRYVFSAPVAVPRCEPSAELDCQRFFPEVGYWYESPEEFDERSESVQVAQRFIFYEGSTTGTSSGWKPNTIGLFQDCEGWILSPTNEYNRTDHLCSIRTFPVSFAENPLRSEIYSRVVTNGKASDSFDNFHQTSKVSVQQPGLPGADPLPHEAGCPECVHDHWRWNLFSTARGGRDFGYGRPLLGWRQHDRTSPYSTQDVDIAVIKDSTFDPNPPANVSDLANGERLGVSPTNHRGYNWFYYIATSKEQELRDGKNTAKDLIHAHGGFFNPSYVGSLQAISPVENSRGLKSSTAKAFFDGPVWVTFEYIYRSGDNSVSQSDTSGTTLPVGYTALNNIAYNIETTAIVSGSHLFSFKAESISDPNVFANLRILHAEFDEFDPHVPKWVDRTILSPDSPVPDFPTRTLHARAESLGKFIIAIRNPSIPVPTTNVKVEASDSPDPVRAGNSLTYNLQARNISSQAASSVILMHILPPNVDFVSATPTQGTCRLGASDLGLHDVPGFDNRVYCQLGSILPNTNVPVSIVVTPNEGESTYPAQGEQFSSLSAIRAFETDTDDADNSAALVTTVLPSLNAKPIISILSPSADQVFVSPVLSQISIPISISATDSDGTISQVSIYDNNVLVGNATAVGGNVYQYTLSTPTYGDHKLIAQAIDNGGRSASTVVPILVNGLSSFSITNPTQTVVEPGSSILIETSAGIPSSRVQKVELFADGILLARLRQISATGGTSKHQFTWTNAPVGKYQLSAILTEYSGATTLANGGLLTISRPPQVTVTVPGDGTSHQQATQLPIRATIVDSDGYAENVDYFINGIRVGSDTGNIASGISTFTWQNPPEGLYTLVVVATDNYGVQGTSTPVSFGINRPAPARGELIWIDDGAPSFSTVGGNDGWNWVNTNPNSLLGSHAHQSLLLNGHHEHYFVDAFQKLPLSEGDQISAWIFIDKDFPPSEVMLQFFDGQSWEHRAYWGDNLINLGTNGTASRLRIGDVPQWGGWRHLKIPAASLGLVGKNLSGMAFTLFNGRAAWDRVGKLSPSWTEPGPSPDFVWIDNAPPAGALLETFHDTWTDGTWISSDPAPHSPPLAHRNWIQDTNERYRQRSFKNPINSMVVNPGDTLFMYVYLYPTTTYLPDTLVVQWYDDIKGWAHRAYWGIDARYEITAPLPDSGTNTEGWRYMGPIPSTGGWVRLEVPASYVGLEGKTVKGMAFGLYQKNKNGRAVFDDAGKTSAGITTQVPNLTSTTPIYRFKCGTGTQERLKYTTNKDHNFFDFRPCTTGINSGFAYGYPAPGAVSIWAWRDPNDRYYLSSCAASCGYPGSWVNETLVAWAPNSNMTDTTPYKFRICSQSNWYFSSFPNLPETSDPASGCGPFGVVEGYVHTH